MKVQEIHDAGSWVLLMKECHDEPKAIWEPVSDKAGLTGHAEAKGKH
jgi:hypothetical protein